MDKINLTASNDFNSTLNNLKQTLKDFGPLVQPIDDVTAIVTDIDDLLVTIGDLIDAANDIDDIILVLGEVLEFLDPIPIVGEIAAVISGTVETVGESLKEAIATAQDINKETIQPVVKTLTDVKKGLADVRSVVVEISQKVPGYINTIEILNYLSQIAAPLTEALEGTDSANKLADLLNTFNDVQKSLGAALNKLNPVINAADTGVKDLTTVLNTIKKAMGSRATDVLNDIKSAANAITPISDGFHRMEEAIKPLAWVLDALSCIFDEILKPVIDLIMHATHLDTLVKTAEDEIFKKIGIAPVMDITSKNISSSDVSNAGNSTGSSQGADSSRFWGLATTALGQYRSGKDGGNKAAILGLISAITNTPIDPNKPSVPPPFPPDTPEDITSTKTISNSFNAFFTPRRIVLIDTDIIKRLMAPPIRRHALSLTSLAALRDTEAPSQLPKIDPNDWPNSAALVDNIITLNNNLDELSPAAAKLEGTLTQFEASLALPATFAHQVTDMSELFTDIVNILDFFESINIDFVNTLVKPFDAVAHNQNLKLKTVTNELPELKTAMSTLVSSSEQVIQNIPKTKVIDQTIRRVEGWSMSINQTIQLVLKARIKDAEQGNKQKANIDAFAQEIEVISNSLITKVNKISIESKTLTSAINILQGGLDTYATNLKIITNHSTIISTQALPIADQAAHILGIVNSIIDPLSGLLQAEGCVDKESPLKIFAASAVSVINTAGKIAVTAQPDVFKQFAKNLAEKALPLTELADAVKAASSSITTTTVEAFQGQSGALINGLTNLGKELNETESYTITITTRQKERKEIKVDNNLFNQELLKDANNIINSLSTNT
jgi:hypothetical protein